MIKDDIAELEAQIHAKVSAFNEKYKDQGLYVYNADIGYMTTQIIDRTQIISVTDVKVTIQNYRPRKTTQSF